LPAVIRLKADSQKDFDGKRFLEYSAKWESKDMPTIDFTLGHAINFLGGALFLVALTSILLMLRRGCLRKNGLKVIDVGFLGGGFRNNMKLLGLLICAREPETKDAWFNTCLIFWRLSYVVLFGLFAFFAATGALNT
jgi:hypothetical protein